MKNRIAWIGALATAMLPMSAVAQVANGNFDRGIADWTWRDSTYALAAGTNCSNVPYQPATAKSSKVPNAGWGIASGRVGYVIPPKPYAVGTWGMCRQMEQFVHVPHGASLTFALQIGDAVQGGFNAPQMHSAGLAVVIVDGTTSSVVYSVSGQSRACDQWLPCPTFINRTVDLAPYWGKTVRLVFRGSTTGQNTQTSQVYGEPSSIYVDNIRIQ
jgi:surface antigen